MGKESDIYDKFARSIAPSIFGNGGASCFLSSPACRASEH